ncbi:MAG: pirin family protein [Hydrotalea flava]|uniref:pirin family protein n=1 Tax=Hydrotalea TaxID=1004300 RepID=UPI000942ADAE|nr:MULTISPECIES: pirin family protein [Hydrotalea]MBY0348864.1 pirin family protein [Hydrotalea flava]RWZ87427.1 MAG: pirin family protein [Hydrotalea sp. AMD]
MKTILHTAASRGHAQHGWLNSWHTFSFADYYNPERMHFGALRVLNDDTVAPGMGFGAHPHQNMEIISIPLHGDLHHKDNTGRDAIIKENDVQIMSAGSGIVHSETNANKDKQVQFLQIWVMPKNLNIAPRYQQITLQQEDLLNRLKTIVAPNDENALWINQDAWFSMGKFSKDTTIEYRLQNKNHGVYIFMIEGAANVNKITLNKRDALGVSATDNIPLSVQAGSHILLMEVPILQ